MADTVDFYERLSDRELRAAEETEAAEQRVMRLENAFLFAKLAYEERRRCRSQDAPRERSQR